MFKFKLLSINLFFFMFFSACVENNDSNATTNIIIEAVLESKQQMQIVTDTRISISDINSIILNIKNGSNQIVSNLEFSKNNENNFSIEAFDLPANTNLLFEVVAYDSDNQAIFKGSKYKNLTSEEDNYLEIPINSISSEITIVTPSVQNIKLAKDENNSSKATLEIEINNPNQDTLTWQIAINENIVSNVDVKSGSIDFSDSSIKTISINLTLNELESNNALNIIKLITETDEISKSFLIESSKNSGITISYPPLITGLNISYNDTNITVFAKIENISNKKYNLRWSLENQTNATIVDNTKNPVEIIDLDTDFHNTLKAVLTTTDINYETNFLTDLNNTIGESQNSETINITSQSFKFINIEQNFTRDNLNDIVKDEVTGLKWEDIDHVEQSITYSSAENYCEKLTLGLINDWRVPTLKEVWYLNNRSKSRFLDSTFKNFYHHYNFTYSLYLTWTSNSYQKSDSTNWYLHYLGYSRAKLKSEKLPVRCVSGTSDYEGIEFERDDYNEIVIDKRHNLMWQDDVSSPVYRYTYRNAETYCSNLTLGGYSGWRLPTIAELFSITEHDKTSAPFINKTFKSFLKEKYLSKTLKYRTTNYVWALNFNYGYTEFQYILDNDYTFPVRCVRDEVTE